MQPYTPWTPNPDREYASRKTHRGARGQKHCQRETDTDIDLTEISKSGDEPEAKYHRRRSSPQHAERSPSRRHSPGYRPEGSPAHRQSAYQEERGDHHNRHARQDLDPSTPLRPYPYTRDRHDPRVTMPHNPYAPPTVEPAH